MGLSAYSAYRAAQDLKKGNYGGAALNALGVLPAGGTAFKAARALGAGRNLARGASTIQRNGKSSIEIRICEPSSRFRIVTVLSSTD